VFSEQVVPLRHCLLSGRQCRFFSEKDRGFTRQFDAFKYMHRAKLFHRKYDQVSFGKHRIKTLNIVM